MVGDRLFNGLGTASDMGIAAGDPGVSNSASESGCSIPDGSLVEKVDVESFIVVSSFKLANEEDDGAGTNGRAQSEVELLDAGDGRWDILGYIVEDECPVSVPLVAAKGHPMLL